jgi:excisionase family DNA binding protein
MKHNVKLETDQREWLDLKSLTQYACVSERTLREWIHRPIDPLPAARVGAKILVRRSTFDQWLENHRLKSVDVGCIVDEMVAGVTGTN